MRIMSYIDVAAPVKSAKNCTSIKVTYCSLFWLFMFGSVAGFMLEGLWCVVRKGAWENHSATIWGPFCIIYGFGAIAVYLISSKLETKNLAMQYVFFSATGAMVEYFGSLIQEVVLGSTSWDYSNDFMNIGGRISLQTTLVWGTLGIVFVHLVFPTLVRLLGRMEGRFWLIGCIVLSVFMAVNILMSAVAILRWKDRLTEHSSPSNAFEQFLDENYSNDTMEKIYPNMRFSR